MKFKQEINDLSWDPTDSVIFICTSGQEYLFILTLNNNLLVHYKLDQ